MKSTHTFRNMLPSRALRITTSSVTRRLRAGCAMALLGIAAAACGSGNEITGLPSNPATETFASVLNVNVSSMTKLSDNLFVKDSVVGTGADAVSGKTVTTTYVGYLSNGARFDAGTISFVLGAGKVIAGWDQGIPGMKVGGTRKIVIGSTLGYGTTGSGIIPPNATLVFNVTITAVQ
jgi:FKBP-type peptidyl-prolyl cis-trans isomerase FkpA